MPTWAMWVGSVGLILLRALLAASESALYGTSDLRAKELASVHPRRGARVLRHKTNREATAAALRFGMVLFGFFSATIAALLPLRLLTLTRLVDGDEPWFAWATRVLSVLIVAVFASVAEAGLRAAASARPEDWALRTSALVSLTVTALYPIIWVLVGLLNLLLAPFGTSVKFEAPLPPLDELEKMIARQAAKGEVDSGAPALIRSIFELSDKTCRDVMVPRTEVSAIDVEAPTDEILRLLAEDNHSRMPVYKNDPDHIVGVLHVRDLVPMMQHPELIVLPDIIRPAHFVPWVKPVGDLLREMQRKKIHMAMVVDEYGGVMGLVTLEDILREIVGDIGDEFDVEVKQVEKQADGSFLVDAMIYTADFAKAFVPLPEGEYETLAGFLSSLAGHIPEVGEKFTHDGWMFIVHGKVGPRLDRIRVVKLPKASVAKEPQRDDASQRSP
jgi:putative hemolysin